MQKDLKSNIPFLRYGNFIDDVITDWWKVHFQKKRVLKFGKSGQRIGDNSNSEVHFYMEMLFSCEILQATYREYVLKIPKYVNFQNEPWDHILTLHSSYSKWSLVLFNMLSRILLLFTQIHLHSKSSGEIKMAVK